MPLPDSDDGIAVAETVGFFQFLSPVASRK
jgi:hypothetical protein